MAALQADDNLQSLLIGQLVVFHHRAEAGGVGANGLLHEDVLARGDGGGIVDRAEARRRGQQDDIGAGGDRLLVGVETSEDAVLGHVDSRFDVLVFPQFRQAALGIVGEGVGDRDQLDILV